MLYFFLIPFIIAASIIHYFYPTESKRSIKNRHVVVTGGSSGIGKCVAILAAKEGADVTIIARNSDKLTEALEEIKKAAASEDQVITKLSVDVSNFGAVQKAIDELEKTVGTIYMLVNCAGMAICGKLEDVTEDDVTTLIKTNFLGTLYPIKAILAGFKERQEGIIVLTASQVALMGMYGYSVYSSCKFALRGLAESLNMEVKPYGITVTLALPPDTDTPGFENENKSKPLETKLLSESGGLHQPEEVAAKLLDDALSGRFFSYVGFESFILTTLCVGMSPFSSVLSLLVQVALMGPLRLISAYYVMTFDSIVERCYYKDKNGSQECMEIKEDEKTQ